MKLSHFRIQNYKVIDDTDWIPVDPSVTALVGKNESGKSGILRAIWKTNNVAGGMFDKLVDYPRDRYSKDRKGTQDVVSLKFLLNDAEADELAAQFTALVDVRPTIVTRTTKYDGAEKTASFVKFEDEVEDACDVCGQRITDTVAAVVNAVEAGPHRAALETAIQPSLKGLAGDAHNSQAAEVRVSVVAVRGRT